MHFEGAFAVAASRERVFGAITDPNQLAACIPDLRKMHVKSQDEFDAAIGVGVSVIRGDLSLHFRTVEREAPSRVRLMAHGSGLGSVVDVEITAELAAGSDGGTSIKWSADASVGGKLASFGQGLVKSQAESIVRRLIECLRSKFE